MCACGTLHLRENAENEKLQNHYFVTDFGQIALTETSRPVG